VTTINGSRDVLMPKLGMTMQQATIIEWHAADGDWVEKDSILFTIESEKAALDIEAPASGTLEILVAAGETVGILEPVARLLADDRERQAGEPEGGKTYQRLVAASPKARAAAREAGVTLTHIRGSGPRGMIVVRDLEGMLDAVADHPSPARVSPIARRIAEQAGLDDLSHIAGSGPRGRILREDVERALASRRRFFEEQGETVAPDGMTAPLAGLRAVIAERLSASWRERPHVTLTTEADASDLVGARQQINAATDAKVSYNAMLVAVASRALREHPYMNVSLTPAGIESRTQINIGVAVDTGPGLLVPVVHAADTKDVLEIQRTLDLLVERAIGGKNLPDELVGGTFTISNLGPYDIDGFTPIINPPESAILGIGRIVAKPVAVDGQVVVRDRVALSLSFDHRVVDGAPAARFLQRVKDLIERPLVLLLERRM